MSLLIHYYMVQYWYRINSKLQLGVCWCRTDVIPACHDNNLWAFLFKIQSVLLCSGNKIINIVLIIYIWPCLYKNWIVINQHLRTDARYSSVWTLLTDLMQLTTHVPQQRHRHKRFSSSSSYSGSLKSVNKSSSIFGSSLSKVGFFGKIQKAIVAFRLQLTQKKKNSKTLKNQTRMR